MKPWRVGYPEPQVQVYPLFPSCLECAFQLEVSPENKSTWIPRGLSTGPCVSPMSRPAAEGDLVQETTTPDRPRTKPRLEGKPVACGCARLAVIPTCCVLLCSRGTESLTVKCCHEVRKTWPRPWPKASTGKKVPKRC